MTFLRLIFRGGDAMKGVTDFIKANGWEMSTNTGELYCEESDPKVIRDLPWRRYKNKQFPAWTQAGILYVLSNPGWHNDCGGIAYNPNSNRFSSNIECFKPIGGHWYVWWTTDSPNPNAHLPAIYE
jgi:hypothetical protein